MVTGKYEPDPSLEWAERVLLRVEVGSTAHGTGLPGGEDYDEIGVMALPWQQSIGIPIRPIKKETINYRPGRKEGERSQPGDYDLVVHSARKFCSLAAQGNPSVLMVLYGPERFATELGRQLRSKEMRQAFWSEQARARFLGYAVSQRKRLEGVQGGKHTNRPELIEKYGLDTKYDMHMLRLGFQGIEYMKTGHITLPIPDPIGKYLRSVRNGEVPLKEILYTAEDNESLLKNLKVDAPDHPNYEVINDWLKSVYDLQY